MLDSIRRFSCPFEPRCSRSRFSWIGLILAGYLVRVAFMPISGQHDVMFMAWQANFISQGHLNIYQYLYEQFGGIVLKEPAVWAPYPYGFYALTSLWLTVIKQLNLAEIGNWTYVWGVPQPARLVFLLKLAYLPFDLLIGYLLYRSQPNQSSGRAAWALWSWSPAAIYTPFMMGQNDVYATALMIAGLYVAARSFASRRDRLTHSHLGAQAWLSMFLLGLGAAFKSFPLFLVPPVALMVARQWHRRLMLVAFACVVFGLAALPFVTTPAFLSGVLLNPEGMQLFHEFKMLGFPVPLFFVFYIGLLMVLSSENSRARGVNLWQIALVVLSLLFILVPTPLYWLIWITPLLIAEVGRQDRGSFLTWLVVQTGFSVLLLTQPRELGVALPVHLSGEFNIPNLSTAVALISRTAHRTLSPLWPLARSAVMAGLGVAAWRVISHPGKRRQEAVPLYSSRAFPAVVGPMAVLFLGLALNLCVARNMVSENNWLDWRELTLTSESAVASQTVDATTLRVTGVRLRIREASDPAVRLSVCLIESDHIKAPLACASASVAENVEDGFLYFLFDQPQHLVQPTQAYALRIELETDDATVTFPYSTDDGDERLLLDGVEARGSFDLSLLHPFSMQRALQRLLVQNVWADPALLALIAATGLATACLVPVLYVSGSRLHPLDRLLRSASREDAEEPACNSS